jgi:hypothetical protein
VGPVRRRWSPICPRRGSRLVGGRRREPPVHRSWFGLADWTAPGGFVFTSSTGTWGLPRRQVPFCRKVADSKSPQEAGEDSISGRRGSLEARTPTLVARGLSAAAAFLHPYRAREGSNSSPPPGSVLTDNTSIVRRSRWSPLRPTLLSLHGRQSPPPLSTAPRVGHWARSVLH